MKTETRTERQQISAVGRVSGVVTRARARGGKPTLLTPDVEKAICADLRLALPDKYAAEANGIASATYYEWLAKGETGEEPYAAFYAAVTRARAQAACNLTRKALAGGKGASHATWLLERRFREFYGPQQRLELAGDPNAPLHINRTKDLLDGLTIEELRKLANLPNEPED